MGLAGGRDGAAGASAAPSDSLPCAGPRTREAGLPIRTLARAGRLPGSCAPAAVPCAVVVDRLERLLNLVIALRETRRPLPASEIRERVAGYGQPEGEAFRRMFERDKADLRALGVPVQSGPLDRWDDRLGYRIDPVAYDLPPVRLEPRELAALALALSATGLADRAGTGLAKLEVDAALDGDEADLPGLRRAARQGREGRAALELELDAPNHLELMEAQLTRTPVRFTYRPLGRAAAERIADPHALVHRRGFWYLVAHDHARDARRAFRLDRIVGAVQAAGAPESFPPAPDAGIDDVVPSLPAEGPMLAEVAVSPAVAWQVARRASGGGAATVVDGPTRPGGNDADEGRTTFRVPVGDPERFVRWALEYGPDLEVLGPADLRARLVAALRAAGGRP